MGWNEYLIFIIPAIALWILSVLSLYLNKKKYIPDILMILGILMLAIFITGLWIKQKTPPMRSMGETRLWYAFFLSIVGFITYKHWKYKWLLLFTVVISSIFAFTNIVKPEIHTQNLMPALQSYWFVPHVTAYILSYTLLGAATIASIIQIWKSRKQSPDKELFLLIDNLVYVGFGFLMIGMLIGSIWAKEAWGDYWSWDPKETWAFITATTYLIYIHVRIKSRSNKASLWILPIAFIILMITWLGISYLPSAQNSIHVY